MVSRLYNLFSLLSTTHGVFSTHIKIEEPFHLLLHDLSGHELFHPLMNRLRKQAFYIFDDVSADDASAAVSQHEDNRFRVRLVNVQTYSFELRRVLETHVQQEEYVTTAADWGERMERSFCIGTSRH
jgi:hypothetical protein